MQNNLSNQEIMVLSNFFLHKNFPYISFTVEEVSEFLCVSKVTAGKVLKSLSRKGLIKEVKGFVNFYNPLENLEVKRLVLERLGLKLEVKNERIVRN